MNVRDLVMELIDDSGMTLPDVSRAINRERTYVQTTVGRGHMPRLKTFVQIADVCGYDVLVRRRIDDYEIPIDPYED